MCQAVGDHFAGMELIWGLLLSSTWSKFEAINCDKSEYGLYTRVSSFLRDTLVASKSYKYPCD